jgi:hypothetical protein
MRSALDPGRYGWLQECAPMAEIWEGGLLLLDTFQHALSASSGGGRSKSDPAEWRGRYYDAVRRFQEAGIATPSDVEAGAERYAQLRASGTNGSGGPEPRCYTRRRNSIRRRKTGRKENADEQPCAISGACVKVTKHPPDLLRQSSKARQFVRAFDAATGYRNEK